MSLFEKINKFNQYISFHIFAFAGWLTLFIKVYLIISYYTELHKYGAGSWMAAYGWLQLWFFAIYAFFFLVAFIVFLFERAFYFKIKNKFLIENKILKILRYTGAVLALIYIIYNLFSLVSSLISSYLLPNELIYYDIHAE